MMADFSRGGKNQLDYPGMADCKGGKNNLITLRGQISMGKNQLDYPGSLRSAGQYSRR